MIKNRKFKCFNGEPFVYPIGWISALQAIIKYQSIKKSTGPLPEAVTTHNGEHIHSGCENLQKVFQLKETKRVLTWSLVCKTVAARVSSFKLPCLCLSLLFPGVGLLKVT